MPEERLLKPVAGGVGPKDHWNLITPSASYEEQNFTKHYLEVIHRIFSTNYVASHDLQLFS